MGLLPFEFLPFRRLRGVQTVIQNRVPVKTGDSGAFSAATGPPLNLGRGPGVAYDLSGPLFARQVRTSFKHYRTDTCPTDDNAGPSHAATSSPADALFSHVAVREKQGMRPAGFGLLKQVDDLIYNENGNDVLFNKYINPASQTVQGGDSCVTRLLLVL
jgi:hypothetical protein